MNFYSNTTTERASKGQGGNQFLSIQLTYKDDKKAVELPEIKMEIREALRLDDEGKEFTEKKLYVYYEDKDQIYIIFSRKLKQKGKKQ